MGMVLTQVVLSACLVVTVTQMASVAVETSVTGGPLQSLVPIQGDVCLPATSLVSFAATSIVITVFLLVASGIKT